VTLSISGDRIEARCDNCTLVTEASLFDDSLRMIHASSSDTPLSFDGSSVTLFVDGHPLRFEPWTPVFGTHRKDDAGHLKSPMPGRVIQVLVSAGQAVKKGEVLVILEAMKMEHSLRAPFDAVVDTVPHRPGDAVREGVELVTLHEAD
jgi:3-methylcrotonyl-CoA carboxylase alpha subunit